jgi:hypothetical protein
MAKSEYVKPFEDIKAWNTSRDFMCSPLVWLQWHRLLDLRPIEQSLCLWLVFALLRRIFRIQTVDEVNLHSLQWHDPTCPTYANKI